MSYTPSDSETIHNLKAQLAGVEAQRDRAAAVLVAERAACEKLAEALREIACAPYGDAAAMRHVASDALAAWEADQ